MRGGRRWGLFPVMLGLSPSAWAGVTIPAGAAAGPAQAPQFVDDALGGLCGTWGELTSGGDIHDPANLPAFSAVLQNPASPSLNDRDVVALDPIDVARHTASCVSPGNYAGGATWPTNQSQAIAAARFEGFVNVTGPVGTPVTWTLGLHGNDSVRLTVGGVEIHVFGWYSQDWKRYRHVTFAEPGLYPIVVEWATNHACDIDPLELVVAKSAVAGMDGAGCANFGGLGGLCTGSGSTATFALMSASELIASKPGDSDGDGFQDWQEGGSCGSAGANTDGDGLLDVNDVDDDNDGLSTAVEVATHGTQPKDADSDDDGLTDRQEIEGFGPALGYAGLNPLAFDSDGDGIGDGVELGLTAAAVGPFTNLGVFVADADPSTKTDPLEADSDLDGLDDGVEDLDHDGRVDGLIVGGTGTDGAGETNPNDEDTDGDGLEDGAEAPLGLDPRDADSDDGGTVDGQELIDLTDPTDGLDDLGGDPDDDGLTTAVEALLGTDPRDADTDADGLEDGAEVGKNGLWEPETETDPLDADTDDDGLADGDEVNAAGPLEGGDPTDPLVGDSDGDQLGDGLELGLTAGVEGGLSDGFGLVYAGSEGFVGDADSGLTVTDPLDVDSDGDGLEDGSEDEDLDGAVDLVLGGTGTTGVGETDPSDDDTDHDGLRDGDELETSPIDADSDDGGVGDGVELMTDLTDPTDGDDDLTADPDDDGLNNAFEAQAGTDPRDGDSDDDGLSDGDELGADGVRDPLLETDPLDADSDEDGLNDGDEVLGVGVVAGQGPLDPLVADSDGDHLGDGLELGLVAGVAGGTSTSGLVFVGTAPGFVGDVDPTSKTLADDPDSDGDGLDDDVEDLDRDGAVTQTLGGTGTSGSGETDPAEADSDGDGLDDGDELLTSPLDADSDDGGVQDGQEVLVDDTDPTDPLDDFSGDPDGDGLTSGVEAALGTDPQVADTDGDGIDDGDELGGDGTLDEGDTLPADVDSDDDGISDLDELAGTGPLDGFGPTDPLRSDSDGDGIADGVEAGVAAGLPGGTTLSGVAYGGSGAFVGDADPESVTNPNALDTDDDGLDDDEEDLNLDGAVTGLVIGGTGTVGMGETDPNVNDTDADGLLDGAESLSDPRDADSDDGGVNDGVEVLIAYTDPLDGTDDTFDPGTEPDSDTASEPDSDTASEPDSDTASEPDSDTASEPGSDPDPGSEPDSDTADVGDGRPSPDELDTEDTVPGGVSGCGCDQGGAEGLLGWAFGALLVLRRRGRP